MNQTTAAPHSISMFDTAGDDLVTALNALDVPFLVGGTAGGQPFDITPCSLLARLATSPEARLRLAVIPLLLRHPEFAAHVDTALEGMPAPVANGFKCYCAAAALLQRKYWKRLQTLGMFDTPLPPLFFTELAIPHSCYPNDGLKLLAERQALLSGQRLNWLGTHEHAAQRFLTHMERRVKWNV